jgi:hypothetical protein
LDSPQLFLQKFKVEPVDYDEKSSSSKSLHKATFFAFSRQGKIEQVFLPQTKDSSLDNFLRSIVSLFQYQLIDGEKTREDDISGTCDVKYVAKSSTKFMKYKSDCTSEMEFHERVDKPLGVSNRFTRANVISTSADGKLESIHSTDHHRFLINSYPNVGFTISSLYFLKFDGKENECEILKVKTLKEAVKGFKDLQETNLVAIPVKESQENMNVSFQIET